MTSGRRHLLNSRSWVNLARTLLAQAGLDRSYRKIFAIGIHKTATTSIHAVFQQAGLHALHSASWCTTEPQLDHYTYQAFSDGRPLNFREMDQRFPRSRFILNVRDLDEWIDSRIENSLLTQKGHSGRHLKPARLEEWVRQRQSHHLAVLDHFKDRPGDLLVINFIRDPDAARKISHFVGGTEVSDKPYVRTVKKTRDLGTLKNAEMVTGCLQSLGIPPAEWKLDLYCPALVPPGVSPAFPPDTDAPAGLPVTS